ncbi:YcaO-like family protein [Kribbella sp. NPDC004138]
MRALLEKCDGLRAFNEVAAGHPDPELVVDLLDRLMAEGCLTTSESDDVADRVRFPSGAGLERVLSPDRPRAVAVLGDGALAGHVHSLLVGGALPAGYGVRSVVRPDDVEADELLLVVLDDFDHSLVSSVDQIAGRRRQYWSALWFDFERGWFGPHVVAGETPSYADLVARRTAAAREPTAVTARTAAGDRDRCYLPPISEQMWLASIFVADIGRLLTDVKPLAWWHQVELDPVDFTVARHPVLPLPDRAAERSCRNEGWLTEDTQELLVDEHTGIVTRLDTATLSAAVAAPTWPSSVESGKLITTTAAGCDVSRVGPWHNDPVGGGSSFTDPRAAAQAAVGEIIERYCGNVIQESLLRRASYSDLVSDGEHAVDPEGITLFSQSQYAQPGFPFHPLTRDQQLHWVAGWSDTDRRPAWLPASLTYINWYNTGWGAGDKPVNGTYFAGVAAGPSLEFAIDSGLTEIIERHATMVWWLNRQPLSKLRATPLLRSAWRANNKHGRLRGWLLDVENEFGYPVVAGVVEDQETAVMTIGFAARADPEQAALKAWAEGLILQDISADLLRPDNDYVRITAKGRLPDQGLKRWRADRNYLDDYRADFRDVITLICQAQVFLDPRAGASVRGWVDTDSEKLVSDVVRPNRSVSSLQEVVEAAGYDVFHADLTTPDIRAAGMTVARAFVPGTVGNFPAAFPFLGRRVAQEAAVRLGWRSRPLAEEELTMIPIPHA